MTSVTHPRTPTPDTKDYFRKLKLALRAFGVSLRDNDSMSYKIYSFLVFFLFMLMYVVLDIKEIFKSDSDDANSLILYFFPFFLGTVKGIYMLKNRIEVGKLLEKLQQEPFKPNRNRGGNVEEKLIKKCVWITHMQTYIYWICAVASATTDTLIVVSKRIRSNDYNNWEFAYGKFAVLNITYSPNYEICLLYQTVSTIPIAGNFMAADLIIAAALAHISCHFQILQNYIKQIPQFSYEEMVKETGCDTSLAVAVENGLTIPWRYLKKFLTQAVRYHLAILSIAEEVEKLFKHLLLLIFLTALGTLCLALYHASKVAINDPHMFGAIGVVLTACLQVFLLCYWGEQVIFQSQEVGRAAFETNYIGTDIQFQKSLALMIRRSGNSAKITASSFSVIGLSTFLWILRSSYSAFMMLRKLQN